MTLDAAGAGMPAVQARRDLRELAIQRVGLTSLRYPLSVVVGGQVQPSVGRWTLDVALALDTDARIGSYGVDVANHESIHAHDVFANLSVER
ncbi:hypothetical protein [Variovorax terrae]|uniref:Uncharacterized protein n=1 Tax=Variovorax terrae TaxID=2923278 RepID=A0A9X1VUI1_9BURK|nr:hypothetical protein [Variovorax terrae]MCJ0764096.1 hypothetical protein [Variovorax terrae]